jgi:arsenate reductase (thioredoxin)
METSLPTILFVCVHNAGRSQIAAAFTEELGKGKVQVLSAGTTPASEIHPAVIQAMHEVRIDLTHHTPRLLDAALAREADVVITMGCGDACPVYPGKRYEDWPLPDPATKSLEEVRTIRDQIKSQVETLLSEIVPPTGFEPAASCSGGKRSIP